MALLHVAQRRCSLCGTPLGRPNPTCMRCQLRRDPPPPAPPDPAAEAAASAAATRDAERRKRLADLGRRIRVGLVGCSASKRAGRHPAKDLYTGNFFRRALPIAISSCDEAWILSARHGLVALTQELDSYDEQLPGRQKERGWWGRVVITSLCNQYGNLPLHLVFYAGAPYVEGVTGFDPRTDRFTSFNGIDLERCGWTYDPLRGLARAERFAWFAEQQARCASTEGAR